MCDLDYVPFYVNEAGRRLVGLDDLEHFQSTPVKDFFFPEDQDFVLNEFFPRVFKEGRAETEIRFRHFKTGEAIWMTYDVFFLEDGDGKPVGLATVSREITERKRVEEALREADRHKDEFLATLAHELRNPLAPIRNGLAVLGRGATLDPDAKRVQGMMERQVDHLIRLVDDLLEISRIRRGKIELRKERADLASVIEHAVEMNRDLIDVGGLELRIALPHEPLLLEADAVRLTQIFANLLNNSAKYTDQGGRIEIAAERAAGEVVVSVVDTGVGIAKHMLQRVFDLFAQAGDTYARSKGGLGIGLALVRGLVELHEGTIEAHSEGEGRGARFVVRLPLCAMIEEGAPPLKAMATPARVSRRVLVVDDAPDVGDSLALLLKTLGANVRVAQSGAEGIAIFAEFAPELIFLDIGMPGMDGFETARRMRDLPTGRKAMLIALTGWGEEQTRRRASEAGFDRHLTKPADLCALEALLDRAPQSHYE